MAVADKLFTPLMVLWSMIISKLHPGMACAPVFLRKHLLAIALILFVSAGCSTSFTYNQLDWLIPWYVEDYVSLDGDQKDLLRTRVDSLLDWHRNEELAVYIALLDRIEDDSRSTLGTAMVRNWLNTAWKAAERIEASALPAALDLGERISGAQMDEFIASLWQRQRELEEEYLQRDDDEYRRDVYRRLEKNLSRFIGRLDRDQQMRLQRAANEIQRYDRVWLRGRESWLNRLEPLLRQRRPGWQQAVLMVHETRRDYRPAIYYSYREYNLDIVSTAIADVINDLDGRQQRRLAREINQLRNELRSLRRPGNEGI